MQIGMLWFDDSPKRPADKIMAAITHYRRKYGEPNTCYLHPDMAPSELTAVEGVIIRRAPWMLPHHLWLGREEDNGNSTNP